MTEWKRTASCGSEVRSGTLLVGDTGKVYAVADEQYWTGGDFVRVHPVVFRRGRWTVTDEVITGQHTSCTVVITLEELERHVGSDRRALTSFFTVRRKSRREELRGRGRSVREFIESLRA